MPFAVDVRADADCIVVALTGELDTATGHALVRRFTEVVDGTCPAVRFDLSRLEFLDSSGVQSIERCRVAAEGKVSSFVLANPTEAVRMALRLTAYDQIVDVVDS
jgi:anti-anti-sigma factor